MGAFFFFFLSYSFSTSTQADHCICRITPLYHLCACVHTHTHTQREYKEPEKESEQKNAKLFYSAFLFISPTCLTSGFAHIRGNWIFPNIYFLFSPLRLRERETFWSSVSKVNNYSPYISSYIEIFFSFHHYKIDHLQLSEKLGEGCECEYFWNYLLAAVTVDENWAMKIKVYCVLTEREPDFVWCVKWWYREKWLTSVWHVLHVERSDLPQFDMSCM